MPSPNYGLQILLISSWLNLALYATEINLAYRYMCKFPNDSRMNRGIVRFALVVDTISTVAVCGNAWIFLVGTPRTGLPPTFHRWPLPTLVIATACSASLEQSFLIFRFWKLRHAGSEMQRQMRESASRRFHKLRDVFMAGFLALLVCTHTGFALTSGILIFLNPIIAPGFAVTATTVAKCVSGAADILIAIALVWQLRTVDASFRPTQSLIRRLIANAIASGAIVAVTTLLLMVLFLVKAPAFNIFSAILGRLYSITILVNLSTRLRKHSGSTTGCSDPTPTLNLSSIRIERSLAFQRDDDSGAKDTSVFGTGDNSEHTNELRVLTSSGTKIPPLELLEHGPQAI
ncbi:hypothetical protein PC9H_008441 [Pleurotus ostreatus]|uniref:DUF6534 domain-containing protein n=1 Tax=Pleurotus ostreatus TaxID=5322 RepID=A0A8H7DQ97_PLEOS|nr:uncharacterized protein PC9H_008441 [Pleurotus ostreatus]KAF7426075.1 hypothetical protein PC9H_008441 [Pleurotus ostreatus]KAJ8693505.1 hypothetical protein PTI98_008492 [Pleurotus ostreatus]